MLKANELRIGNLIYVTDNLTNLIFKEITPINIHNLMHLTGWDKSPLDIIFEPIPLTEEWLLKFGFVHSKTDKSNVYKLGSIFRFVYCFDGKFKGKDMLMFGNIQLDKKNHLYVHQLQNLHFALIGKELELC